MSTQTIQTLILNNNPLIKENFPEINKNYEKLKKCLYPNLFGSSNNNGKKEIF